MQTKRDQLHAYKYLVRRVLASMIGNDPESPEQPMKRVLSSTLIGIMLVVVVSGVVALVGWLGQPKNAEWVKDGHLIIEEKTTGAQFVYVENTETGENELREVENYASAQLILGAFKPEKERLNIGSLKDIPRGKPVGIVGAPKLMPQEDSLRSMPWSVCSRPPINADPPGGGHQVGVLVGKAPRNPRDTTDQAIVVRTAGENAQRYLIWNGKKLPVPEDWNALGALQLQEAEIVVGTNWLHAIPTGQQLQGPQQSDRGDDADDLTVDDRPVAVGQVFKERGTDTYFLAYTDHLRPITPSQANLLLSDPAGARLPGGVEQDTAVEAPGAAIHPLVRGARDGGDIPYSPPEQVSVPSAENTILCAMFEDPAANDPVRVVVADHNKDLEPSAASRGAVADAGRLRQVMADFTTVDTGSGAVVAAIPQDGESTSAFFVVTDDGKKFAVQSRDDLRYLGYDAGDAPKIPPEVLRLIPSGPALTAEKAADETIGQSGLPSVDDLTVGGIDPDELSELLGGLGGGGFGG